MHRTDILPRIKDGSLFHFTKAESLMKIIENMTLKLSSFDNLNDLNEIELNCSYTDSILHLNHKKHIAKYCKLLSFSQNYISGINSVSAGYNHPRMWAQYADNNSGACLVIDEEKFIKKNLSVLEKIFFTIEDVSYNELLYDKKINSSQYEDSNTLLRDHYKHIFFNKHIDWEREHERRFLGINAPAYLSIDGCIEFICLGRYFNREDLQQIIRALVKSVSRHNQILTPHDFVIQTNIDGRIMVLDYAHAILSNINKLSESTNSYKMHLEEIGYEDIHIY